MVGRLRETMGTLYQESPLHRSIRLATRGFSVSDYIKRFAAKESPEEKEGKGKHVLPSRGSQVDVHRVPAVPQKAITPEDRSLSQKTSHCSSPHSKGDFHQDQPLEIPQQPDSSPTVKAWTQKVAGEQPGEKILHGEPEPDGLHVSPFHHPTTEQSSTSEEPKTIAEEPGGGGGPTPNSIDPTPICETSTPAPEDHLHRKCTCAQTEESQASDAEIRTTSQEGEESGKEDIAEVTSEKAEDKQVSSRTQTPEIQTTQMKNEPFSVQNPGHPDINQERDTEKGQKGGVGKTNKAELVKKEPDSTPPPDPTPDPRPANDTSKAQEPASVHIIDDCPPPPAPFNHRIVSIKQAILSSCYTVCQHEVLGGGRFGQVHKCVEISSGLRLAAKIVKVKAPKDRDEVKNEINVMNQLNHVNLIQLYDAFECKNDLTLIMEYLDGGELFDRITDENYHLTELDAIMFCKQICEGIYYLHQQYILHLDLKPENILCVSRTGNQIKIIDFGLARRYKPREKLKVNFGTPEFLAPEVVNYDFVSFPTDMWSIGVITYMLVSGLSPFLGESDAETMNYIVNCNWEFDLETFEQVSEEAKDFISKLLVKEKSCRLSAGQCLKHEWLSNLPLKAKKHKVRLKSQIMLQRYMAQRKWKKHFYVVAAANRLRKFQLLALKTS
ncbi:myosin light chain kinase 3 isoform X2 [Hyperolius riggenbachi]|uniref:myosin light chain kinase 3 isoform X2 n=1 Tax=Hyperolius riggenbachi TaxID=752182 RepID=UPI0035A36431